MNNNQLEIKSIIPEYVCDQVRGTFYIGIIFALRPAYASISHVCEFLNEINC